MSVVPSNRHLGTHVGALALLAAALTAVGFVLLAGARTAAEAHASRVAFAPLLAAGVVHFIASNWRMSRLAAPWRLRDVAATHAGLAAVELGELLVLSGVVAWEPLFALTGASLAGVAVAWDWGAPRVAWAAAAAAVAAIAVAVVEVVGVVRLWGPSPDVRSAVLTKSVSMLLNAIPFVGIAGVCGLAAAVLLWRSRR